MISKLPNHFVHITNYTSSLIYYFSFRAVILPTKTEKDIVTRNTNQVIAY